MNACAEALLCHSIKKKDELLVGYIVVYGILFAHIMQYSTCPVSQRNDIFMLNLLVPAILMV